MDLESYQAAKELEHLPFHVLIMAAMMNGNSPDIRQLNAAFPDLFKFIVMTRNAEAAGAEAAQQDLLTDEIGHG